MMANDWNGGLVGTNRNFTMRFALTRALIQALIVIGKESWNALAI